MRKLVPATATGLIVCLAVACSSPDSQGPETTGSTRASLKMPGMTPVPFDFDTNTPRFDGNTVALLFADALVGCSRQGAGFIPDTMAVSDAYASTVKAKIEGMGSYCGVSTGPSYDYNQTDRRLRSPS